MLVYNQNNIYESKDCPTFSLESAAKVTTSNYKSLSTAAAKKTSTSTKSRQLQQQKQQHSQKRYKRRKHFNKTLHKANNSFLKAYVHQVLRKHPQPQ